ncbi:MAG: hypothetical protein U0167_00490 [bacterium]
MKRILILVLALLVPAAPALANYYGWMISASQTQFDSHTGGIPSGGLAHLYLWYACNVPDGMSAADLGLQATGVVFAGFSPLNGFLNAGSGTNLLLAVGGCPNGPIAAGDITVFYFGGPASLCIVNSINNIRVTVDCTSPTPSAWDIRATGWDALVRPSCDELACVIGTASAPRDWGAIKSLYR